MYYWWLLYTTQKQNSPVRMYMYILLVVTLYNAETEQSCEDVHVYTTGGYSIQVHVGPLHFMDCKLMSLNFPQA